VTRGNYHVSRTVLYPDYPRSKLVFDTDVQARGREWSTQIRLSGDYDAPTDVVGVSDYRATWTSDGKALLENGTGTLRLSGGGFLRIAWTSTIVPKTPRFDRFPRQGETIDVTFSSFQINGNTLTYDWHGTVRTIRGPAGQ
jgi:hypothetical protein